MKTIKFASGVILLCCSYAWAVVTPLAVVPGSTVAMPLALVTLLTQEATSIQTATLPYTTTNTNDVLALQVNVSGGVVTITTNDYRWLKVTNNGLEYVVFGIRDAN